MVWIPGGRFQMGSDGPLWPDEAPAHEVELDGFWMDATEVTNARFRAFVEATGYVTTAERAPVWEELASQLPPGTPRPDDALLVAGSLVFVPPAGRVPLNDVSRWWRWTPGASWRAPSGPGSSIEGQDDLPVVQVSWDDAAAYARWAGKSLPSEAQWEWAARGGGAGPFPWGTEPLDAGAPKANTWQGTFPTEDRGRDGFRGVAPVGSFAPNAYGLFDMAGNVWEWCADWYRPDAYKMAEARGHDPRGPPASFDPAEPTVPKRVQRGGSFLCNDSYCLGYRVTARMKSSPDSSTSHTGFRCVRAGTAPSGS